MKLISMAWMVWGASAFALGVMAEACATGSSAPATNCATLQACCSESAGR